MGLKQVVGTIKQLPYSMGRGAVTLGVYANPPFQIALTIWCKPPAEGEGLPVYDGWEVFGHASVQLPQYPQHKGRVFVKNWSEGQEYPDLLIQAGVIEPTRLGTVQTGHVQCPVYQLSDKVLELGFVQEIVQRQNKEFAHGNQETLRAGQ